MHLHPDKTLLLAAYLPLRVDLFLPPHVHFSSWTFPFIARHFSTVSTPIRLCQRHLTSQHWPEALMKNCAVCSLQYDLFIPTVDAGRLKSTAPNQCSCTEGTNWMMNPQMFFSPLCSGERCGKGNGLRRKKLNQLLFHYSFDSSFLLIFYSGSVDKRKLNFFHPSLFKPNYHPAHMNGNYN